MQTIKVKGQSVQNTEWKQKDRRTEATALPDSLMRLITIIILLTQRSKVMREARGFVRTQWTQSATVNRNLAKLNSMSLPAPTFRVLQQRHHAVSTCSSLLHYPSFEWVYIGWRWHHHGNFLVSCPCQLFFCQSAMMWGKPRETFVIVTLKLVIMHIFLN